MTDNLDAGIAIEKIAFQHLPPQDNVNTVEGDRQSHRHNSHTFHLLETGTVHIDIDFQQYTINSSSVIYIHPDQVHRTTSFDKVTVVSLAITDENLNPEYLKLLEDLVPTKPVELAPETFALITETTSLCLKLSERRSNRLYHSLLKDACNTLVALILSTYLDQTKSPEKFSRFELVTKAFRGLLEHNYTTIKRPAEYARKLNLSTAYLNECVKGTTGHSVSFHIQQRIILEASRLLYHSDQSVKEIAAELGYDDYPYFSRLFTKATGMTALAFRAKNRD
ncbi:helix-turn-helix domain-containing protein [Spirosoma endbachense]|uniref:Helix-turn-helix domain-containing protein n=1 Tax=Spirosoma endbachense TaxID=2666025 RepID=A0A6P1W1F9_9BACT|nr:helix-turn-helix domain-containing protein [Spirosoma endbachense]QHV97819.1 helix-turn-helix domain-containing protein [Spirosoma endbachense]